MGPTAGWAKAVHVLQKLEAAEQPWHTERRQSIAEQSLAVWSKVWSHLKLAAGGDSSADDSGSASSATNEVKVRRHASVTRQEADHLDDALAKQLEDWGRDGAAQYSSPTRRLEVLLRSLGFYCIGFYYIHRVVVGPTLKPTEKLCRRRLRRS
jgi:hypothetical protein